jgi:hypothetical protein
LKTCTKCKIEKPKTEFSKDRKRKDGLRYQCKACGKQYRQKNKHKITTYHKEYYQKNREEILAHDKVYRKTHTKEKAAYHRLRLYGVTQEMFTAMLVAQDNRCKICDEEFILAPCVDHCHTTTAIRGLLCRRCNASYGWYENHKKKITTYETS